MIHAAYGVGGIAVIAYQIVCGAGIATGKVGQQGHRHFHSRVPRPQLPTNAATAVMGIHAATSCRPALRRVGMVDVFRPGIPASLCHAGLHFQLRNVFFRSDTEVAVNSTLCLSFCKPSPPVFLSSRAQCSAAWAAASSSVASFILSG